MRSNFFDKHKINTVDYTCHQRLWTPWSAGTNKNSGQESNADNSGRPHLDFQKCHNHLLDHTFKLRNCPQKHTRVRVSLAAITFTLDIRAHFLIIRILSSFCFLSLSDSLSRGQDVKPHFANRRFVSLRSLSLAVSCEAFWGSRSCEVSLRLKAMPAQKRSLDETVEENVDADAEINNQEQPEGEVGRCCFSSLNFFSVNCLTSSCIFIYMKFSVWFVSFMIIVFYLAFLFMQNSIEAVHQTTRTTKKTKKKKSMSSWIVVSVFFSRRIRYDLPFKILLVF